MKDESAVKIKVGDRTPGIYEKYCDDILKYLQSKFPDAEYSTIAEAASFISYRTSVVVVDMQNDLNKYWRKEFDRYHRKEMIEEEK